MTLHSAIFKKQHIKQLLKNNLKIRTFILLGTVETLFNPIKQNGISHSSIWTYPLSLKGYWGEYYSFLFTFYGEMVLLSMHNICFGLEIILVFNYTLLALGQVPRL